MVNLLKRLDELNAEIANIIRSYKQMGMYGCQFMKDELAEPIAERKKVLHQIAMIG